MIDAPAAGRGRVRTELVEFVRALRRAGVAVPANAATTAARALVETGFDDRDRVRTALRATLVSDESDIETFDRLFAEFWGRLRASLDGEGGKPVAPSEQPPDGPAPLEEPAGEPADGADRTDGAAVAESVGEAGADAGDAGGEPTETALYSPTGDPRAVRGSTVAGVDGLEAAFRELTRSLAGLRGRRWEPGDGRADVRRALRASFETGGTVLSVPGRERRRSAVRSLLLVDVSRSVLDTIDREFLVEFLRRARRHWRDARVFFFDEDLREVTDAVDAPSASVALEALAAAEAEWGGGTRIGGSVARLHGDEPDAVDRRTVVFVVSDGLEMGDVDVLEREVSWLARRGKRVLWLNPLAASGEYEPAARGMAAARPYLDGLFAFAGPGDVAELARQLRRQGPGGRIGYEYDPRRSHT